MIRTTRRTYGYPQNVFFDIVYNTNLIAVVTLVWSVRHRKLQKYSTWLKAIAETNQLQRCTTNTDCARVILGGSTKQTKFRDKMRPSNLREAYPQITYVSHRSIIDSCLFLSVCKITTVLCDTPDTIYKMILSPLDCIHEWVQCALGTVRPCRLASSMYMYICVCMCIYVYICIYIWDGLSSSSLVWSSIAQSVCQQAFSLLVNRYLRPWVRILPSAEEDNSSPLDSNIACLCQSIEINNNKHVYRQSQVRKPTGSEVEWAECLLIIGTGCRVQV